ncbi:type II secretion system protein GspL [Ramlibacter sp.]|uniref:type II secretion system protein GspL n=1 Tax=Ramlibacter sp. TaxID=1917967 RepID=UPI002CB087F4|nr:type II secretion system protein GspL [Ramlibacter sp.]HWI83343.1 type II secretion system protein GspL [Ramlibacter sp.]
MSALIVLLPPDSASASAEFEYVVSNDGRTIDAHGSAQAAVLPLPGRSGAEVVAVVPTAKISWHRVELPKGTAAGSPRLRAVLEGLLEDQLLDEPEALHFALPPQAKTGVPVWVATCDRAWLRSALHVLEAAQRPVSRIVPEFAPEGAPVLHALGEPQHPMLVMTGSEGVVSLPLSAQALTLLPALPESTLVVAEPAVAALAEQVLQHRPELQQSTARWLEAAQADWDLAQFEFSSSSRARALKKIETVWADLLSAPQWRAARWGAALLVGVNLLGLNAWAWRERATLDHKRESMRQILTQTFPQVKVVVEPAVQMTKEVAALRQTTGAVSSRDLEAMLGALSSAPASTRAAAAIEYNNGELRVKGLASNQDEAEPFIAALSAQGYGATLQGDALVITKGNTP